MPYNKTPSASVAIYGSGDMEIFTKESNQIAVPIIVRHDDKVARILELVAGADPTAKKVLMFAGRVLSNEKTVAECNVRAGAVLLVMSRMFHWPKGRRRHCSYGVHEWDGSDDMPVHKIDVCADDWLEVHHRGEHKGGRWRK